MNWRWYLFWMRDAILGGKIYSAYKDIRKVYNNYDKNEIEEKINNLLKHSSETTEFYRMYKGKDLRQYPIMNKATIKENYESIESDIYKGKKLHKMSTSGSTGTPFTVVQNKDKRSRVIAEILFFGKLAGYTFGERQMFLRAWVKNIQKTKLQKFLQNMLTVDISNLNEEKMQEIVNILRKDKKVKNLFSYANTLENLVTYMEKDKESYKYKYGITSILSGSELLKEKTRERLKKVFKCNVISRYANQENGILGQECIEDNHEIHLNYADYYFEFLKLDKDEPAKEGELSRIVITDLWNYALPMIRYDTGDLAIVGKANCSNKQNIVIKEIYGRRMDLIYNTKGDPISPHLISRTMCDSNGIKQFKFIQKDVDKYTLVLNLENDGNEFNEGVLVSNFKELLGTTANIVVEYTNEIPVLSSGKRKEIENLYKK